MNRKPRVRLMAPAITAAVFAGAIGAFASAAGAPPVVPVEPTSHPLARQAAVSEAVSPNAPRPSAPISLAFKTADGNALYTPRVNQITCRSLQGSQEWLGTHLGVKMIDAKAGSVRHYTRRDGLPGDYVEDIAADAKGVFCIVRVGAGAGRIALCGLDPASGKWKTLQEARPVIFWNNGNDGWQEGGNWQRLRGRSRLALNPHTLLFAPATVGRESDAMLYAFDRAAKTVRPIAWDPAVRADNPVLGVSFLRLNNTHAFLGTNIGLLTLPLPPAKGQTGGSGGTAWQRSLPDRFVDAGALSPDGKTLWLAVHNRMPKSQASRGESDDRSPQWNLVAVDTQTRRVTATASPGTASYTFPDAVTLDSVGNVWLTSRSVSESRRIIFVGKVTPPVLEPNRFDRYTPATNRWTHLTLSGDAMRTEATPASSTQIYTPPPPPKAPAGKESVPDAAVIEFALDRATDDSSLTGQGISYRNEEFYSPLYHSDSWVRARFPQWYCLAEREPIRPTYAFVRDPAKPGWVWSNDGRTLVHRPETAEANSGEAARYPFEVGGSLAVRPHVEGVIARGRDSDRVIVHTSDGFFELREDSPDWKPLYRSAGDSTFHSWNTQIVRLGPDGSTIGLRLWSDKKTVRYLDAEAGGFVESPTLSPPESTLIAGGTKGAWFRGARNDGAHFVPLDAAMRLSGTGEAVDTATLPAELLPPAERRFSSVIGATGDIAWFSTNLRRSPADLSRSSDPFVQSIIGYDRARRRWTAPLQRELGGGYTHIPFLGEDDATYIPHDTAEGAVFRYAAAADRWEKVAAPLPTMAQLGDKRSRSGLTLLAAGGRQGLCLTDWKYLYRYDSERETWSHEPLPQPLQDSRGSSAIERGAAATKAGYWLGSEQGLWRYDIAKRVWQEREFTFTLPSPPETAGADKKAGGSGDSASDAALYPRIPDSRAVWGNFYPKRGETGAIFRFDRAARTFRLYNQRDGVPIKEYSTLMSDGDGLWMVSDKGAYRLDPGTGKAALLFRSQYRQGGPAEEQAQKSVRVGSVAAVEEDPADAQWGYVLLNSGGAEYPNEPQPAFLYRVNRRSGELVPLPIPAAFTALLKERNAEGPYFSRPPSVTGSGGLLVRRGGSGGSELWVGTTAGVFLVDPASNTWRFAELPPGVPSSPARTILAAPGGAGVRIHSIGDDIIELPGAPRKTAGNKK